MARGSGPAWVAAALLLPALAGCAGLDSPFRSCRDDAWPDWAVGASDILVCVGREARTAVLYVPPGAAEANLPHPVPLLLMLHGGGGHAEQLRQNSGMDEVADELGFAVLYADGTPARRGLELRTWNAMTCCGKAFERGTDDVSFLGRLLGGALAQYPVDEARVGVAGHSNGAMMAYRLAAERSDLVASAMAVAGTIGGRAGPGLAGVQVPDPAEPVSVLILHAKDDDHVPYDGGQGAAAIEGPRIDLSVGEAISFWWAALDASPESNPVQVERDDGLEEWRFGPGSRGTEVVHVATTGGHGWPGSSGGFNPAPALPDASREIGLFLGSHPRAPPEGHPAQSIR